MRGDRRQLSLRHAGVCRCRARPPCRINRRTKNPVTTSCIASFFSLCLRRMAFQRKASGDHSDCGDRLCGVRSRPVLAGQDGRGAMGSLESKRRLSHTLASASSGGVSASGTASCGRSIASRSRSKAASHCGRRLELDSASTARPAWQEKVAVGAPYGLIRRRHLCVWPWTTAAAAWRMQHVDLQVPGICTLRVQRACIATGACWMVRGGTAGNRVAGSGATRRTVAIVDGDSSTACQCARLSRE